MYVSRVIATFAWPSRSDTTFGWIPAWRSDGGVSVAQIVEANVGQGRSFDLVAESLREEIGVDQRAVFAGERQPSGLSLK